MTPITQERCFNHRQREAAARCPECHRFFCRECVTEHDDRVICAACLLRLTTPQAPPHPGGRLLVLAASLLGSFFLLWLVFYGTGRMLLLIPSTFHEGTLWDSDSIRLKDYTAAPSVPGSNKHPAPHKHVPGAATPTNRIPYIR